MLSFSFFLLLSHLIYHIKQLIFAQLNTLTTFMLHLQRRYRLKFHRLRQCKAIMLYTHVFAVCYGTIPKNKGIIQNTMIFDENTLYISDNHS